MPVKSVAMLTSFEWWSLPTSSPFAADGTWTNSALVDTLSSCNIKALIRCFPGRKWTMAGWKDEWEEFWLMRLMEPTAVLSRLDAMIHDCDCAAVPLPLAPGGLLFHSPTNGGAVCHAQLSSSQRWTLLSWVGFAVAAELILVLVGLETAANWLLASQFIALPTVHCIECCITVISVHQKKKKKF